MTTADTARVRAVVAALHSDDRRTVLAMRADPMWSGPEVLDGSPQIRVVPVSSPLAAREAVLRHKERGQTDELLVLLTSCASAELGLDLRAQLLKGDVQTFDPFTSALALFDARVLDPALARERWLIEDLIELAPAGGWTSRSPVGGVLTIDAAWRTWQEERLGEPSVPASLLEVLELVERAEIRQAVAALGDARGHVAQRWSSGTPSATAVILDAIASHPVSPTALGIVVGLLWSMTEESSLAQRQLLGRARLEPFLGRDRLTPADAAAWGSASGERVSTLADASGVVAEAERLIAEIDARELGVLSDILPSGFDARLDRLGVDLGSGNLPAAEMALAQLEAHVLAPRRARQIAACRAGVRLLRRTTTQRAEPAAGLADRASYYRDELAWLEQARRDIAAGTQSDLLATALGLFATQAADVQLAADREFAAALAEWSVGAPISDTRIVPVESILEDVVAPVAKAAPVLLVICDGMGLSVSHQLIADLRAEGWAPASPEDGRWPVGIAVLPTVTTASRTSLFSGQLVVGVQNEERAGFAASPALRRPSKPNLPPVLFHKAGLVASNGAALPDAIRAAVANPDQRIVGVVVNSVDDHLARGDQINVGWDLASLGPLGWLLSAAAEAGRVVVLTSDHGHVLDNGRSISRPQTTQGGERWRTSDRPAGDGEIEIHGPRVVLGGGRVVMPFDERIRYGPPKHGYHGGATAEEVLVPVEVLARELPAGWMYRPATTPSWWDDVPAVRRVAAAPGLTPRVTSSTTSNVPTLFDQVDDGQAAVASAEVTWVDDLLASASFQRHRTAVRLPRPLPDDRLRTYLEPLAANGNSITLQALAAATGEPLGTLRMTVSVVQRLLNIDGAAILAVLDDGAIVCNVDLLAVQFGLGEGGGAS